MTEHYVYQHIHPVSGIVLYIGHGSKGRAWVGQTLRSEEHASMLDLLTKEGFLPCDWVKILARKLTKEQAKCIERELIQEYKPLFNKAQGKSLLALNKEQFEEAAKLRSAGLSFTTIAKYFNVAPMTIHRALSGKAVRYNDL